MTTAPLGRVSDHLIAVENTARQRNMIVCTLCSCYPWEVLGLPPVWYKSAAYRSRSVIDPRGVLKDFGVTLPAETEIRVWDSTAETRFIVIPMRPAGTEGWDEEQLAELVTRDSMVGTGEPLKRERGRAMNGVHDMGGMHGFGPVTPEKDEPVFHAAWEGRVLRCNARRGCSAIGISIWAAPQSRSCRRISISASPITRNGTAASKRGSCPSVSSARTRSKAGHALHPAKPVKRKLTPADVDAGLQRGSYFRKEQSPARFKPGDKVRTKNINPTSHTRLPRYARDRVGTVEAIRGCHVYPDSVVLGKGEDPQWLYTVVFDGTELWGPDAAAGSKSRSRLSSPIWSRHE